MSRTKSISVSEAMEEYYQELELKIEEEKIKQNILKIND